MITLLKKTMFQDYKEHPKLRISASILWEYDITSPSWDWNHMAERVVQRVIQYGTENDYIAMLQLYGGFENVAEIIKRITDLSPKDLNWASDKIFETLPVEISTGVEKEHKKTEGYHK